MKDVLLLNPPFVSISRPAIGISILKAVLTERGFSCDVRYPNIRFAEEFGLDLYTLLDEKVSDALFAGDWLFAQHLFPGDLNLDAYVATLQHHLQDPEAVATILGARDGIGPYVEACLEEYRVADYRIIGLTSTFEQNLACLALSRAIKDKHPEKVVVFGGANCEAGMGMELHRSFPWIDYVCTGEAEAVLPELVEAVVKGRPTETVGGFIRREGGRSVKASPSEPIQDLDSIPIPDYDDYFETLNGTSFGAQLKPSLLLETSRGCWWGAKQHCTFCGLNGETMSFRSKSADRVIAEIRTLLERHGIPRFMAVDNIIDMRYFRDVLPRLKRERLGVSLFYETKANLNKDQVELLRDSGIMAIQPGVESLSTHVLKLMRKGVSAIQNMQLLKWCKEYGVTVAWNLLYGFPGETDDDYRSSCDYIESLYHLQPPHSLGSLRVDRFSPYFKEPDKFGLTNIRPFGIYNLVYPLTPERIANLAYFFEHDYQDGRVSDQHVKPVVEKIEQWKRAGDCNLSKTLAGDPELVITDTRPNRVHEHVGLNGVHREVYELCDSRQGFRAILAHVAQRYSLPDGFEDWLRSFLDQMVEWRLMVREKDQYLSLAVSGPPDFGAEGGNF